MTRPFRHEVLPRGATGTLLVAITLFAVSCGSDAADRALIQAWLTCEECDEQQRQDVAVMGNRAVSILTNFLEVPASPRLQNIRLKLSETYHPVPGLTRDAYVALMVDGYLAMTQSRAAASLGDIATPDARAALNRALAEANVRGYRRDVVQAIARQLARVSYPRFDGSLGATDVDFGDTVRVHAGSIAWDGNESVALHGSPFGSEVFLNRFMTPANDDSLEFVAVGELGGYAVAVTNLGPNDVVQVDTTLRIRSLRYTVHDPATADVITQADLPQVRYLVLGANGADTIDYVRVAPTAPVSVTATARWPGLANVHVAWRSCGPGVLATLTLAGRVVLGSTGTPVGAAQVRVAGTALSATTTATGDFAFAAVPPGAAPGGLVTLSFTRVGYAPQTFRIPLGTSGHVLGVVSSGVTAAGAVSLASTTVPIGAGGCRLLQVWTSTAGRHRIVQLRIEP